MRILRKCLILLTIAASMTGVSQTAQAGEDLLEAIRGGKFYFDERYRYEHVKQANRVNTAKASTLRNRVGYKSGEFYSFLFSIEFENVMHIGNDRFNNTLNGRGTYPVVADVKSEEINQLFLQYNGIPNTMVKAGRQVITIDNHRFVGHVGWRQNNQTFDAVLVKNTSLPNTTLTYGYIDNVNRIFGDDSLQGNWRSNSHILHAATKITGVGTLTGYGFLLDFEDKSPVNSSSTFGISLVGKRDLEGVGLHYRAEFAHQEDYADNPVSYEADYYHLSLGVSRYGLKGTIAYEVLGSDSGNFAFRTPLATGHIFNGYADQFLVTPNGGLEDFYLELSYKLKDRHDSLSVLNGLLIKAQYHDFSSDQGSVDYGTEFDLFLKLPLGRGVYIEGKYADFDANAGGGYVDVEKYTFGVGWKY